MEKISIIIPVYKIEKYLDRCLESVVNQTYTNLEIILIDDGSPDNSPKICDEWAKKDKRIKVIHKKNEGVSIARNKGLEVATGEYIGFVDGDDYIEPNMYKRLYELIKESGADIAQCRSQSFSQNGEKIAYEPISSDGIISDKSLIMKLFITRNITFTIWNKLFSKKILNDIRFTPNFKMCEDMLFEYFIMKKTNKVVVTNNIYYNYYKEREDSATKITLNFKDAVRAIDLVRDDLGKIYQDNIKYLDNYMILYLCKAFSLSRGLLNENKNTTICEYLMLWSKTTLRHRLKYLAFKSGCSKVRLLRAVCEIFFPNITDYIRRIYRLIHY